MASENIRVAQAVLAVHAKLCSPSDVCARPGPRPWCVLRAPNLNLRPSHESRVVSIRYRCNAVHASVIGKAINPVQVMVSASLTARGSQPVHLARSSARGPLVCTVRSLLTAILTPFPMICHTSLVSESNTIKAEASSPRPGVPASFLSSLRANGA